MKWIKQKLTDYEVDTDDNDKLGLRDLVYYSLSNRKDLHLRRLP